jgi:subtilisin family serine protease
MALNPWLEEKLKKKTLGPEMLPLLVEVESKEVIAEVKSRLSVIPDLSIGRQSFNFIEVTAPVETIPAIEKIPGVRMVHKNMVRRILPLGILSQFPKLVSKLSLFDHIEGEISIDNIEAPRHLLYTPDMLMPFSPLRFLSHHGPLGEVEMIPTSKTRDILLNIPTTYTGRGITVAVLDTGSAPQNPQCLGVVGYSECSTDPLPMDNHAHGSWCLNAATGRTAQGIFGQVQGVAPEAGQLPIKVLHGVFGFGMTMDIMKGIERAVNLGAKVISMSLGGDTCEGGCDNCPDCRLITDLSKQGILFAIAAGNSGPDEFTIGCPGCAPGAITVASVSLTDYPQVAYWSSRGPTNIENKGKTYEPKPDVAAPGGGRAKEGAKPDEVIYSGEEGYMKGLYSGIKVDIADSMHGTSQATPHIAGFLAVLLESGKIKTADDFKKICAEKGHSKTIYDGWGVPKLSWFQ